MRLYVIVFAGLFSQFFVASRLFSHNLYIAQSGSRFRCVQVLDGRSSSPSWGFDGQNGREYETLDCVLIMIKELNPDVLDRLYNNPISDLNNSENFFICKNFHRFCTQKMEFTNGKTAIICR